MTVSSYAARLFGGGLGGGAIEMAACARVYSVDLAVYEEDRYRDCFTRISDFLTDTKPRGYVLLLYSGRSHYDALRYSNTAPSQSAAPSQSIGWQSGSATRGYAGGQQ